LVIHVFIGNFIETHYLGKTMHLSPLFLIISLCFWGMLWGGTGLFLAVPMTVLLMIVFGSFESTRMFAIMLSEKGDLPKDCYGKLE
jgi:AI-2 transport protein TqsA